MEEARRVLERLEQIESMRRAAAGPAELLDELRRLLHDAEAWVAVEGDARSSAAVCRLREALSREVIAA
jgi:hypothetical protein